MPATAHDRTDAFTDAFGLKRGRSRSDIDFEIERAQELHDLFSARSQDLRDISFLLAVAQDHGYDYRQWPDEVLRCCAMQGIATDVLPFGLLEARQAYVDGMHSSRASN